MAKPKPTVETVADRNALLIAGRARKRGADAPPEVAKKAAALEGDLAAKDLSNPKTQFLALNPETMGYVLELESGTYTFEIIKAFKLADFRAHGVVEDLQAWQQLIFGEVVHLLPDIDRGENKADWFSKYPQFHNAIFARRHVQIPARSIIARMAKVVKAVDPEGAPIVVKSVNLRGDEVESLPRLTEAMLEEGMFWGDTAAIVSTLLGMLQAEIDKRKKALTARAAPA